MFLNVLNYIYAAVSIFFTHDAVFFKNFTMFLFESKKDDMPSCMVNSAETRNVTV